MKALICEMCGSNDLVKDGGVFVCQHCGCKYSVEEARKMMIEGTVDVKGTVTIDRSNEQQQKIENYLSMCKDAHEALDTESVVEYSDRILEIDPDNYEAWVYRALSCGWKSTVQDLKTGQVITAAKRALLLAPEDEQNDLAERIFEQGKSQIVQHISHVLNIPGTKLSLTAASIKAKMIHPVMKAWIQLVTEIPYLSKDTMEAEIKDCEALCKEYQVVIPTAYDAFNNKVPYFTEMKEKVQPLAEEREAQFKKRTEEYWEEHAEEKQALIDEKESLRTQLSDLEKQLKELPEVLAYNDLKCQLSNYKKKRDSMGVFKAKEKKLIQEEIDELDKKRHFALQEKENAEAPIKEQIEKSKNRIIEIDKELTKKR